MEWSAIWSYIVEYGGKFLTLLGGVAGLATLIIAVAQFMGKKWIEGWFERKNRDYQHKLDSKLRKYESDLDVKNRTIQNQLDTQLEVLRIKYGNLHTQRLQVIETIHIDLLKLEDVFGILKIAAPKNDLSEKHKQKVLYLQDNYPKFIDYFNTKKIFLSKNLSYAIEMYMIVMSVDLYNIAMKVTPEAIDNYLSSNLPPELHRDNIDNFITGINAALAKDNITAKSILADLQDEFRRLIGAEE